MVKDTLGREFKTLRLSLTNTCNFSCGYCVAPDSKNPAKPKNRAFSAEEFAYLVSKIHEVSPLEVVRLTGGEPTLYKELIPLVRLLKDMGIPKVKMTTNGSMLEPLVKGLKEAKIDSINISLDALSQDTFRRISPQGKVNKVISAIKKVIDCNIDVKTNCTVIKGLNDSEILPLLDFAGDLNIPIRYLELMKMGHLYESYDYYLFSEQEILDVIKSKHKIEALKRKDSSTANYWLTEDHKPFGIIANNSSPFCRDCDRLRLSESAMLYGCLSENNGFPIKSLLSEDIPMESILNKALKQKQKEKFKGSPLSMKAIGG